LQISQTLKKLRWFHWASILAAMAIMFVVYVRIDATRSLNVLLSDKLVSKSTNAAKLVVIIHGYTGSIRSMADVQASAAEAQPEADLLLLEYPAQTFSNADCFRLSDLICERIQEHYTKKHYKHITLVGFSMGALLLRKAYVYGYGHIEDITLDAKIPDERREPLEWVQTVDRFVLLAGMNRGWTSREKPHGMKWHRAMLYRIGTLIGKWTNTGRLIRQCERGEPFVANLRIQWLEVMRALPAEKRPKVIQLLGRIDDLVSDEDNRDATVCKEFIFVPVNGTGHAQAIQFHGSTYAAERRRKFLSALGDEAAVEYLKRESPTLPDDTDTNVVELVVVLHGIRDMGEWTSQFEKPLQEAFQKKNPGHKKLIVYHPSYGFFAMGPFLLWSDRQVNVRWFMDEFTELKAKYPNLKEVHFIGHSNGTYVLASALKRYKTLRIDRAVFAGSVVRRDFDWKPLTGRINGIRNYVGSTDWVVGFFPALFELPGFKLFNPDIGSAGFNGFVNGFGNAAETRFVNGAHGAALQTDNVQSIVAFIMNANVTANQKILVQDHPALVAALSRACWIIWGALLAVIFFLGRWWVRRITRWASGKMTPRFARGMALGSYLLFIWFLLNTI
jgi:pimeloyl-ACP methyl ester carboxylesterase